MKALFSIKNPTKGFTLIELVIVIVLLGILAATALPKFANLTGQARVAVAQGVGGSFGDAVNIAYSQWLAIGQPTGAGSVTLQDGTKVTPNTTTTVSPGYPVDASGPAGTPSASSNTVTDQKCLNMYTNLLQNPPAGALTLAACAGQSSCFNTSASTGSTCYFQDTATPANCFSYNIVTGAVIVSPTTGACP